MKKSNLNIKTQVGLSKDIEKFNKLSDACNQVHNKGRRGSGSYLIVAPGVKKVLDEYFIIKK